MLARIPRIQHEDERINRMQDNVINGTAKALAGASEGDATWQPISLAIPCVAFASGGVPAPSYKRLINGMVAIKGALSSNGRHVAIGAALATMPKTVVFDGTRYAALQYATGKSAAGVDFSAPVAIAVKDGQLVLMGVLGVTTTKDDPVTLTMLTLEFGLCP